MSVTTQKMRKTILISKKEKMSSVRKPPISALIEVISKKTKKNGLQAGNPQLPAAGIEVGDCRFAKRH